MQSIFAEEDDPDLEIQRKRWGPKLKRALPLGPRHQTQPPLPVDLFLLRSTELDEVEYIETEAFKNLILRPSSNSQTDHEFGVAHASGSGKTRLAYALGTQKAHVVLIRLTYGDTKSPAFEALVQYVNSVYLDLVTFCNERGLGLDSPPELVTRHWRSASLRAGCAGCRADLHLCPS